MIQLIYKFQFCIVFSLSATVIWGTDILHCFGSSRVPFYFWTKQIKSNRGDWQYFPLLKRDVKRFENLWFKPFKLLLNQLILLYDIRVSERSEKALMNKKNVVFILISELSSFSEFVSTSPYYFNTFSKFFVSGSNPK